MAGSGPSEAAPFTWTSSGTSPLADGSGSWNATGGTNWFNGTTYGAWGNTNADTATFGVGSGAAGTITVGGVTTNGITFNTAGSGNYTLSSGTVTLAGSTPTITVNANGTTTLTSVLAGSAGLTKTGARTLTLSGSQANTYSGTTTVSAGVLNLNKTAGVTAIPGSLAISNAIVTFGTSNQVADSAAVTMSGASSIFNGTSYVTDIQVALDETIGSLAVTGGAFFPGGATSITGFTVTGSASFTGGAGNTDYVQNSGGLASFGSLSLTGMTSTVAATGGSAANRFVLGGNSTSRQSTLTVGSGGLSLDGSNLLLQPGGVGALGSRLVLNGDVTTTGNAASSIRPPATDNAIGGRAVELSSTSGTVTRTFTIGGGGANLTVSIPITNGSATSAGITKAGVGTLTLGTANTYSGQTRVSAGMLALGAANAISNQSDLLVDGGGFNLAGFSDTVGTVTLTSGSIFGTGTLGGSSYALRGGTLASVLGSGPITVSTGTTTLGSAGRFNSVSGLTISSGQLTLAGSETVASYTQSGGILGGSGNTLTASTYALQGGTVNADLGTGTLNVTANTALNGVSGATAINLNSGTLSLGGASRFTASNVAVTGSSGAAISLGGNESFGSLAGSANVALGSGTLSVGSANTTTSYSGVMSGSGGLTKQGTGVFTLTANNTFSGLTTVSAGTLSVGNGGTSGALAGNVVNNAALIFNRSNDTTFAGNISGSGGLTKRGAGKLTVSGSYSYAGATTVESGTLSMNGQLTGAGGVTVQSGATLGGSGVIAGNIGGDGLIGPGNSPGILTVQGQLVPTSTTAFAFELSGTGAPSWGSASASVNDVLRLTAASPFTSSLAATNIVNVYFDRASLANGDTFLGGFFVDNLNSTANLLTIGLGSAGFEYFVKGDGNGGYAYNGTNYYSLGQYMVNNSGITGVTQSVVNVASATFNGGTITTGQVTQFVIVPEPGAIALALVGVTGAAVWSLRRHRRGVECST